MTGVQGWRARGVVAVLLAWTLSTCGSKDGHGAPPGQVTPTAPLPGYVVDPTVFGISSDPATLLDVGATPQGALRAAPDVVVVRVGPSEPSSEAERIAQLVGGTLVGQIPGIGFYQIQLPTTDLTSLDAAIAAAAADATVGDAGYDLELEVMADNCPVEHDNESLGAEDKCTFEDTRYYQALSFWEELRSDLSLSDVTVGIVDSGINVANPELSNATIIDAQTNEGWTDNLDDPSGHGTKVAAMMVAADKNGGVNGIASRFLGNKVSLVFGKNTGQIFSTLVSIAHVVNAGAKVVNLSLGYNKEIGSDVKLQLGWLGFAALFALSPDVLFVASAPNHAFTLTGTNHAPAGIVLDNVMTVGGTSHCDKRLPWADSGRGNGIHVVAPADLVPVVHTTNGQPLERRSGNSIAAPQVTSVAAILESLRPSLTPIQIRDDYIRGMAEPGPAEVGSHLLSFPYTIGQAILERSPPPSAAVQDVLDEDADVMVDAIGLIMGRVCGGLRYTVSGVGTHQYPAEDGIGSGFITPAGWSFAAPADDASLGAGCDTCDFDLTAFPLDNTDADTIPGVGALNYNYKAGAVPGAGGAVGGSWTFTRCSIEMRGLNDEPFSLIVEGRFEGWLAFTWGNIPQILSPSFDGSFSATYATAGFTDPQHPTLLLLDSICENGRP